jgi:hypothetical protein
LNIPTFYFDVRIDAFVNLKLNFDMVYQVVNSIAQMINWFTNHLIDEINKGVMKVNDVTNSLNVNIPDININIDLQSFYYYKTLSGDFASWNDYTNVRKFLLASLEAIKENAYHTNRPDYISKESEKLISTLKEPLLVSPNIKWIKDAAEEAKNIIKLYKNRYKELETNLKKDWWDYLQKQLNSFTLASNESIKGKKIVIKSHLFNINPKLKKFIDTAPDPLYTWLSLNKKVVHWFVKALNRKSSISLWMSDFVYNDLKLYFSRLDNSIGDVMGIFDKKLTTSFADNKNFVKYAYSQSTAENLNWIWIWDMFSLQDNVDLSYFVHWFFVKWDDNRYRNVIYNLKLADDIRKNKRYIFVDFNKDWLKDILLWTNNSVYIKWADQNDKFGVNNKHYNYYYVIPVLNKYEDIKQYVDERWYFVFNDDTKLKLLSDDYEVNNFSNDGNTYDSITLSWFNDWADAYILKLVPRVDYYYDKNDDIKDIYNVWNFEEKRIVVFPKDSNVNRVILNTDKLKWYLYQFAASKKVYVFKKDFSDDILTINFSFDPRKWRYVRIAKLKLVKKDDNWYYYYYLSSPWSNQVVVWRQIWSDNQLPTVDIMLIRKKTWEIVSRWKNLVGYINTHYQLKAEWTDNGIVIKSWITDTGWNLIKEVNWPIITLDDLYYTWVQQQSYYFYGMDQNWNIQKQLVSLSINIPKLTIEHIDFSEWNVYTKIIAKLSSQIDDWVVRFYRNRFWYWEILTWKIFNQTWYTKKSDFVVIYNSNYITWGLFSFDWKIIFKDIDGHQIASMTSSGDIKITDSNYDLRVDIRFDYPLIEIYNKNTLKTIFYVFIIPDSLENIQKINWDLQILDLPDNWFGIYNNWKCILEPQINQCIMYISPKWYIYIPPEFVSEWIDVKYKYNNWVIYDFGSYKWNVRIKIKKRQFYKR